MAHLNQQLFCMRVKSLFPDYFRDKMVLDIGGADINGSVKYLFKGCDRIVNDIWDGPGVHIVCKVRDIPFIKFNTVCMLEVSEHDSEYAETITEAIKRLMAGGLFLFTCASTNRPEHGTTRTSPQDSPFTTDYYKNLTESDIRAIPGFNDVWGYSRFEQRDTDLRFFGFKKGTPPKFKPSIWTFIAAYADYWESRRKKDITTVMKRGPTSTQIYKALIESLKK